MAKKPSKNLVEKVMEGANSILHPDQHSTATEEQGAPEVVETVTETHEDADQMGDHKKFDKFKGEHLDQ